MDESSKVVFYNDTNLSIIAMMIAQDYLVGSAVTT